ncbi:hypothetical protein Gotur_029196 [Gossypium turneri]
MESEFVGLSLDEEEEEILQAQASIIYYPAMKSTMANLWHLVRGVQIRDLG